MSSSANMMADLESVLSSPVDSDPISSPCPASTSLPIRTPGSTKTSWSDELANLTPIKDGRESSPPTFGELGYVEPFADTDVPKEHLWQHFTLVGEVLKEADLSPMAKRQHNDLHTLLKNVIDCTDQLASKHARIREKQQVVIDHETLRKNLTAAQRKLATDLLRFKRLEVLARYGDYLAERNSTLRSKMKESGAEIDSTVFWTEIATSLRNEEGKAEASQPMHNHIHKAADSLGWGRDVTLFSIQEYASRNVLVHCSVFELVEKGEWADVGKRCDQDLEILDKLFGPAQDEICEQWKQIIQAFRDRFVRRDKGFGHYWPRGPIQIGIKEGVTNLESFKALSMWPDHASDAELVAFAKTLKGKEILVPAGVKEAQKVKFLKLKDMHKAVKVLEKDNRELKAQFGRLEEDMKRRQAESRQETAHQLEQLMDWQGQTMFQQGQAVFQQEQSMFLQEQLTRQQDQMTRQQHQIAQQQHQIAQQQDRIAQQQDQIAHQQDMMARQDEKIAQQQEMMARQDEKIAQQQDKIAQQQDQIAHQQEMMARQDEKIAHQQDMMARQDEKIARLEEEVHQLKEVIGGQTRPGSPKKRAAGV